MNFVDAVNKINRYSKLYVGIPVFNERPYLPKLIESLKLQTLQDVTFFIVDNCSTDGSWDFLVENCTNDARFLLFRQAKNIGASDNFEYLFRKSNCEFFCFAGAHDYFSNGLFLKAVNYLEVHEHISLVSGKPYRFYQDEDVPEFMPDAVYEFTKKRIGRYLQSVRNLSNCTIAYSVFRKRLLNVFKFKKTISNDHILLSRLLWFGELHFLDEECYFRRYFTGARAQTQSQRISGGDDYLSRYEMIKYYLDDFKTLYKGDSRIRSYLEYEIIHTLQHRFGVQSLSINDDVDIHESTL